MVRIANKNKVSVWRKYIICTNIILFFFCIFLPLPLDWKREITHTHSHTRKFLFHQLLHRGTRYLSAPPVMRSKFVLHVCVCISGEKVVFTFFYLPFEPLRVVTTLFTHFHFYLISSVDFSFTFTMSLSLSLFLSYTITHTIAVKIG